MSSLTSSANRVTLVRELIRDTDTVRPFYTDAQIVMFLHEAMTDYAAQLGTVDEQQSAAFLSTDRTKTLTFTGAVSAVIGARLTSINGTPLDLRDFWHVRQLQEREGRVATPEIAGVRVTAVSSTGGTTIDLAIYPLATVTALLSCHTFVLSEPAQGYVDFNENDHNYVVRRAASQLGGLMPLDDAQMAVIERGIDDRFLAGIGLRRITGAPGVQRVDDIWRTIHTEG